MDPQILSRDDIAAVAKRCWDTGERCPYTPGTAAHNIWVREYARLAGEELVAEERARDRFNKEAGDTA